MSYSKIKNASLTTPGESAVRNMFYRVLKAKDRGTFQNFSGKLSLSGVIDTSRK